MKIANIFQIIILGILSNLKEHLDGTFIEYSLTKCMIFCICRKFKMAMTAGYILTQDLYNVKINKMIFERDLIELAYEQSGNRYRLR